MDATFWAFIALVIFVAIVVYMKVPGMIGRTLDERADRIKKELEEARTLREEAQQLLAEYHRKRKEAEKEAGDIVASPSVKQRLSWKRPSVRRKNMSLAATSSPSRRSQRLKPMPLMPYALPLSIWRLLLLAASLPKRSMPRQPETCSMTLLLR